MNMLISGIMLVGFPCLLSIPSPRFLKGLWLCLLIVNGFGIVTGLIQQASELKTYKFSIPFLFFAQWSWITKLFFVFCFFFSCFFCGFVIQVQYKTDCEKLYGQILDNSNVVSSVQGNCKRQTEEIWNRMYPEEPYNFNITHALSENVSQMLSGLEKYTKYDLVSAVKRQSPFFYQV